MRVNKVYIMLSTTEEIDSTDYRQMLTHAFKELDKSQPSHAQLLYQANTQHAPFDSSQLCTHNIEQSGQIFIEKLQKCGIYIDINDSRVFIFGGKAQGSNGRSFQWAFFDYFDISNI